MSLAAITETVPAIEWTVWVLGIIALVAAAVAGLRTLFRAWSDGWNVLAENHRKDDLLDQVLSKEGWPNGAANILEAHKDIYNRITAVETTVNEIQRSIEDHLIGRAS